MVCGQASALTSRVYCFYIPKDKLSLAPTDQIKSATYAKLENRKVDVVKRTRDFAIDEAVFTQLFAECEAFIKDKGKILEIKGSDASSFETLSSFYRISVHYKDDTKLVSALDDEEVLKVLGLDEGGQQVLASELSKNTQVLNQILDNVKNSDWQRNVSGITSSNYVRAALTIAGILAAAWFAPPYVATAVDLLYPVIYQALWGIPSTWSLSYWLVYYPGRMHAVAWAYNNSSLLISATGSAISLARYALTQLSQNLRQKSVHQKLEGSQLNIPQS